MRRRNSYYTYTRAGSFLLGFTISAVILSASSGNAQTPFVSESIGDPGLVFQFTSLALDARGNPHISYQSGAGDLKYATRAGGVWIRETVDGSSLGANYNSIALDPQGNPHISYYDGVNGDLRYATKSGGTWILQAVDATGDVGLYSAIAVDAQGEPHISYYHAGDQDLRYARKASGIWNKEIVQATGNAGQYTSIAIDAEGFPRISYRDFSNLELRYASKASGSWVIETADNAGAPGFYTSIAIDASGNPHISYFEDANNDLLYAARSGGSWNVEVVEAYAVGDVGLYTSIALDSDGVPHIAYYDLLNTALRYATRAGGSWTREEIDGDGSVGSFPSIAIDAQGNPQISYLDFNFSNVILASAGIHLDTPHGGNSWPVGSLRTVEWTGIGPVDILLSTDGGASFEVLASNVFSGVDPTRGSYEFRVPNIPSRFCLAQVERSKPFALAQSDSFFSINADIVLLGLSVEAPIELSGNVVAWNTDPGPGDLGGYRLDRSRPDGGGSAIWRTLVGSTKETSYRDPDGAPGDRYRLYGINGLGEEFYLGEAEASGISGLGPGLNAWPLPYRGGTLNISFSVTSFGSSKTPTEVTVYDVAGRRLLTLAQGSFEEGTHLATWDGRDEFGRDVGAGVYFLRAVSGQEVTTKKIVLVR